MTLRFRQTAPEEGQGMSFAFRSTSPGYYKHKYAAKQTDGFTRSAMI